MATPQGWVQRRYTKLHTKRTAGGGRTGAAEAQLVVTEAVYGWDSRGGGGGGSGGNRRWGAYAMMGGLGCGWSKTSLLLSYLLLLGLRRRLIVDHVVIGL
jgi:hypothetical protein